MPASRSRIRALAVGVAAFALVAVAAGGTFAASNPATLYACYDNYGNPQATAPAPRRPPQVRQRDRSHRADGRPDRPARWGLQPC
jgi:hypothetical protein